MDVKNPQMKEVDLVIFLLLFWKSKFTYLLVLLSEVFSKFFRKVALRPGLVILSTYYDQYKNKLKTVHLQDTK